MQVLKTMQGGLDTVGRGVDAGNVDIRTAVALQTLTMRTLIALAGVWQIQPEQLAQLVNGVSDEQLKAFTGTTGGQGKS